MIYRNNINEYTLEDVKEELNSYYGVSDLEDAETAEECLEVAEEQGIYIYDNLQDDILDDFYNGNWTQGVSKMYKNNIYPRDLIDYIEEAESNYSYITLDSIVTIMQLWEQERWLGID